MSEKSTKPATQVAIPLGNTELFAACRLYRINEVLKYIPVSKSQWWAGVARGIFPAGVKLSARVTCWKSSDIQNLIASLK